MLQPCSGRRSSAQPMCWMVAVCAAVAVVLGAGSQVSASTIRSGSSGVALEVPVTATDLRLDRAVTSPGVARSPAVPAFLVTATRTDMPGPGCGLHASGDRGASWRPVALGRVLSDDVDGCYAPDVGVTGDGRVVVSFVEMSGTPPAAQGLYVTVSDDHAQTFSRPRRLADVDVASSGLAVAEQTTHLVWLQSDDGAGSAAQGGVWPVGDRVVAASVAVGGSGPADPVVVGGSGGLVAAPAVAAGPDGGVVVAYYQLPAGASVDEGDDTLTGAGAWGLMVARRPVAGEGFTEPVEVARFRLPAVKGRPPYAHPMLVARQGIVTPGLAAGAGRTCVGWTDQNRTGLDGLVDCSSEGQRWEQPVRLGGQEAEATFQWMPQVAVTDGGEVAAVFWHHRLDADRGRDVDVCLLQLGKPDRWTCGARGAAVLTEFELASRAVAGLVWDTAWVAGRHPRCGGDVG